MVKAFDTQILTPYWDFFKKLSGLQNYQHFLVETANPGVVGAQLVANGV